MRDRTLIPFPGLWTCAARWLPGAPEYLAFAVGALLRLRLASSYDPRWGWDATPHLQYLEHIAEHGDLPPLHAFRTAYHPPLYYELGGAILRLGGSLEQVQAISIGAGLAALAFVWIALRRQFPGDRLARTTGLLLAAVLPCAIHVEGMVGNEALFIGIASGLLLLMPMTLNAVGKRRWALCGLVGVCLAAAMLTKVSALLLVAAWACGAVLDAWWTESSLRSRARRVAPALTAVFVCLALSLPAHARHFASSGRLFPTGYDSARFEGSLDGIPVWQRRSPGFFVGPCPQIFEEPYYRTCIEPQSHFWPVLVATTFVDYYGYRYAGDAGLGEPAIDILRRPIRTEMVPLMRASVVAGHVLAVAVFGGTAAALIVAWRRRSGARLALSGLPVAAILAQLYWATKFPYDEQGPVKGSYLQFASLPLFGAFGLAVSWLWRRPRLRILAVLQLAALAAVGVYSVAARVRGF